MTRYMIRWGDEWSYQTVPAVNAPPGETLYVSKEAALNAVIAEMSHAHRLLKDALKRARKKQRRMDYQRALRDGLTIEPASQPRSYSG